MVVFPQSWEAPQVDMGEASGAHTRSVQSLEPSSVSPSSFLSVDGATARQELGFPSYSRRLRFRGGLGFKLVLGAIASAAAVAVLIAVCAAASHRTAALQVTRRRLSEGRAPESAAGLAACGETSGDGFGDDPQATNLEEEVEPPPAKKAKVEGEGFDAGDEAGSQAQTSASGQAESASAAGGTAVTPPEAESSLESRLSSGEVMAAQALMDLWCAQASANLEEAALAAAFQGQAKLRRGPQQQEQPPAPQQQAPIPPAPQQQAHLLAFQQQAPLPHASQQQAPLAPAPQQQAQLPLALPQQAPLAPAPQQQAQLPLEPQQQARLAPDPQQQAQLAFDPQQQTAASPSLALVSPPPLLAVATVADSVVTPSVSLVPIIPAEVEGQQPQPAPVQLAPLPPDPRPQEPSQEAPPESPLNSRAICLSSNGGLEVIDPLGEWEPPSSGEAGGRAVLEHAFSRLPRVVGGDHSACSSLFSPQRAISNGGATIVQVPLLRKLRALLAQEELSLSQLQQVGEVAEHLQSPIRFLKPAWNPWREDDRVFYQQFEGRQGQSDPAQPGPYHQSSL
ncbi:hypothetical protein Esti_006608 [Eimeria stiedai]